MDVAHLNLDKLRRVGAHAVLRRLLHQLATVGDDEGARRAGRRRLNAVNEMCKDDLSEKGRKVSYSKSCLYVKKKKKFP
jgi:DNA-binding transcriptional regulator PaaX